MKPLSVLLGALLFAGARSFSRPLTAFKCVQYRSVAPTRKCALCANSSPDECSGSKIEGTQNAVSRRAAISGIGVALSALFLGDNQKGINPRAALAVDGRRAGTALQNAGRYSTLAATSPLATKARQKTTEKGLAATAAVALASSADFQKYTAGFSKPTPKRVATATEDREISATTVDPIVQAVPFKLKIRNRLTKIKQASNMFLRATRIVSLVLPAAIMYPFVKAKKRRGDDKGELAYDKWLRFCVRQAERGGAVVIKLFQWASSRPDMFGVRFCDSFKALQDSTTPHSWEHTKKALIAAYGEDWADHFAIGQSDILGSGCIAQVYKGTVLDDDGNKKLVAVKVVHPNVRKGIACDLQILRFLAHVLESLPFGYGEKLKWNNLSGSVEEFARMLVPQLDLRNEAKHIRRFNENFKANPNVIFPEIIAGYDAHRDVLVESFCTGVPLEQFCREHEDEEGIELRAKLCDQAADTMCRMIFEHNYVHADLHPGNIFISPDNKLVLLDCGIVNEYTDADHDLLIKIISAFIRMDGARAAELMADDSNRRLRDSGETAQNTEKYIADIEKISKTARTSDFFFEKVTTYVNYIFNAASKFKVKMNPSFVSMGLAVKVQEGVALMLNPKGDIIHIANPIIKEAELKRLQTGNFDRIKLLAEDALRDFRVRRDREKNAKASALQTA